MALAAMSFAGCTQTKTDKVTTAQPQVLAKPAIAQIELVNPSQFARAQETVYFSYYDLGLTNGSHNLSVTLNQQVLPSESIDRDGDGQKDGLITLLDFAQGETHVVTVNSKNATANAKNKAANASPKRTQAEISIKQGGQWVSRGDGSPFKNYEGGEFANVEQVSVPEFYTDHSNWIRYEGPGIESDLVGYRIYLDSRNGFDIFGKSVAEPVLQLVGQDGYQSYHEPQEWGMDILKVGNSLGAGGFGYWHDEKLVPVKNVEKRGATIVQDGNLFSGFRIDYARWQAGPNLVDLSAYLSMTAGSRLVHNQIHLDGDLPNLAIGLVDHSNTTFIEGPMSITGDAFTYIATWGPQSLDGQQLGMAVFFKRRDNQKILNDGASHIALMKTAGNEVEYYFAAAWQGEHGRGLASVEEFKVYLDQQAEKLTRPIRQRMVTKLSLQEKDQPITAQGALSWSTKLADSELQRKALGYHADGWDVNRKRPPKFEYDIIGILPYAYDELAKVTGDARYRDVKHKVTASFIEADGSIRRYEKSNFNMDNIAPGRALLRVHQESPQPRFRKALDQLRDQLHHQPKTSNGAFWHKQKYTGQLWLDGVYMGMPFLAEYARFIEEDPKVKARSFDEVLHEFEITEQLLKDPETGLYYHAWDEYKQQEWADPETGLSPQLWARGMGWLAMGLVDVLEHIPSERIQDRQQLINMTVDVAKTLERYQDDTGTWWQIMDKPHAIGNYRESSATAMFSYFLAKAINNGWLTEENFGPGLNEFALRSYRGLINEFALVHADGTVSMTNQCLVAGLGFGRDGSYDYYMNEPVVANDPKGTAPFILAGVEMHKLLRAQP